LDRAARFQQVQATQVQGDIQWFVVALYLLREIDEVVRVPAMYWVSMTLT